MTRRRGFSLVEMMVVVTILLLAFGMMVPSLAEFFKNRRLQKVTDMITNALFTARMQAVVSGRPMHVVFFKEGPRIYDQKMRRWQEEDWDPRRGPGSEQGIHFDLFFAGRSNDTLPSFAEWKAEHDARQPDRSAGGSRGRRAGAAEKDQDEVYADTLVAIIYDRDGTLSFRSGLERPAPSGAATSSGTGVSDIPTARWKPEEPEGADIVVWQLENDYAGFIDVQPIGTVKNKAALASKVQTLRGGLDDTSDEDTGRSRRRRRGS